jgi:hypothetical protein
MIPMRPEEGTRARWPPGLPAMIPMRPEEGTRDAIHQRWDRIAHWRA